MFIGITFALGQRHYALPHVFRFNYSSLHLRILLQPDNYHSMFCNFCCILFVVYVSLFQPIPSLRLIYRSFLRTVMTVNLTMRMMWESYTPPRNEQVHEVRSLNTDGEGANTQYLSTDNDHGTNTNCKTCCPSASIRDDEN